MSAALAALKGAAISSAETPTTLSKMRVMMFPKQRRDNAQPEASQSHLVTASLKSTSRFAFPPIVAKKAHPRFGAQRAAAPSGRLSVLVLWRATLRRTSFRVRPCMFSIRSRFQLGEGHRHQAGRVPQSGIVSGRSLRASTRIPALLRRP